MEKLSKIIAALEYCNTHEGDVCPDCPGFHDDPVPCSIEGDRLVLGYLKEYRELMERNTWPCWECEYAWMKFRKYKSMFGPDNCDLHRDKMCPVLDEEVK